MSESKLYVWNIAFSVPIKTFECLNFQLAIKLKIPHVQVHCDSVCFENLKVSHPIDDRPVADFFIRGHIFVRIFCNYFKQLELVFIMMEVNEHKWVGFVDLDK